MSVPSADMTCDRPSIAERLIGVFGHNAQASGTEEYIQGGHFVLQFVAFEILIGSARSLEQINAILSHNVCIHECKWFSL